MQLSIKSAVLKKIFAELGVIFKNSEQFRAFNFTVRNGTLYINANTGICYEARIYDVGDGEASINVLFQDVSDILGARNDVKLNIEPNYVLLTAGAFQITFSASSDSVTPLFLKKTVGESVINAEEFSSTYSMLANTGTFRKAYRSDPYLCFAGEYAYVKFPTLWLRTTGCGIHTAMDRNTAYAINIFSPSTFSVDGEVIRFYNDTAVLSVPYKEPEEASFEKVVPSKEFVATWELEPVAIALKKAIRVIGEGQCTLTLGGAGFVLRAYRRGVNTSAAFGDVTSLSNISVQLPVELWLNAVTLLNTRVSATYGGGKLWLKTQYSSILIAVTS